MKQKGIYVRNLNEEIVKTPKEVMDCIQKGESNRHISATDYNDRSSRSHTIFQLVIESRQKSDESKTNSVQISQLVHTYTPPLPSKKKNIYTRYVDTLCRI